MTRCDVCQHEADTDAAGVCASCRDHRQELEGAGEVIARLAGLLEKAEPYVAGGYPYGQAVREELARDIRAALGDHRPAPRPVVVQCVRVVQCARPSVEIGGIVVRPMHRDYLDGRPVVPFWRAVDRRGEPHDAATPEAAAAAAGARIAG